MLPLAVEFMHDEQPLNVTLLKNTDNEVDLSTCPPYKRSLKNFDNFLRI